jgi:plastocyanin
VKGNSPAMSRSLSAAVILVIVVIAGAVAWVGYGAYLGPESRVPSSSQVTASPSLSTSSTSSTPSSTQSIVETGIFYAEFTPFTNSGGNPTNVVVPTFYSGLKLTYLLTVQLLGGTTQNLTLSLSGPSGITFAVNPAVVSAGGASEPVTVMVAARPSPNLTPGSYPIVVMASGGGASYTESLTMNVAAYLVVVNADSFAPSNYTVPVGATVTFLRANPLVIKNDDGTNNIHFSDPSLPVSPGLKQFQTWSYTFTKPGTYPYVTDYRPDMKGVINVTP